MRVSYLQAAGYVAVGAVVAVLLGECRSQTRLPAAANWYIPMMAAIVASGATGGR